MSMEPERTNEQSRKSETGTGGREELQTSIVDEKNMVRTVVNEDTDDCSRRRRSIMTNLLAVNLVRVSEQCGEDVANEIILILNDESFDRRLITECLKTVEDCRKIHRKIVSQANMTNSA